MDKNTTYIINYQAVKEQVSYFTFDIDHSLFEQFAESELHDARAKAEVKMTKHSEMLELVVGISGDVEIGCDRCLDLFWTNFEWNSRAMVFFGNKPEEAHHETFDMDNEAGEDDVIWIDDTTKEGQVLDLTQYIYESIVLSLPIHKVHPDISLCNQDMIQRFTIEQ